MDLNRGLVFRGLLLHQKKKTMGTVILHGWQLTGRHLHSAPAWTSPAAIVGAASRNRMIFYYGLDQSRSQRCAAKDSADISRRNPARINAAALFDLRHKKDRIAYLGQIYVFTNSRLLLQLAKFAKFPIFFLVSREFLRRGFRT